MMANLTLSVEDDLLKKCRLYAVQNDTSVNAMVREYLVSVAALTDHEARAERLRAVAEIERLARRIEAERMIPEEVNWKREDAYAERLGRWDR